MNFSGLKYFGEKMNELNILSWNVNGLRTRFKGGYLKQVFELNPDILCFQEVKSTEDQIPKKLKEIEGYYSYFCPSKKLKGYAGVAIYTKSKPKTIEKSFSNFDYQNEGRILKATFENFVLFNIYFPSAQGTKEGLEHKFNFYEDFLEEMEGLREVGENVIICGDFNIAHTEIDLVNPKVASNNQGFLPKERAFLDKLVSIGHADTFRMFNKEPENYTWWPYGHNCREKNIGMRLDHFFVSESFKGNVKGGYILSDIIGSDHCPIGVDIVL